MEFCEYWHNKYPGFIIYKLFAGASQAAKKEELGSSEEHFGQYGQRHIPHHLV